MIRQVWHWLRFRRDHIRPIPRRNLLRYSELIAQDPEDGTR